MDHSWCVFASPEGQIPDHPIWSGSESCAEASKGIFRKFPALEIDVKLNLGHHPPIPGVIDHAARDSIDRVSLDRRPMPSSVCRATRLSACHKTRSQHGVRDYFITKLRTHTLRSTVVLQLWSSLTADMLMAANGEAQERSMRCGLLVFRAWLVGSRHPWGT